MKKPTFSSLKLPVLLITMLLLAASCARSPYNFVKVQPKKPVERASAVAAFSPGTRAAVDKTEIAGPAQVAFKPPVIIPNSSPAAKAATSRDGYRGNATSRRNERRFERQQAKEKKEQTHKVVNRELKRSAAFGALPAKKLEKVEKIISKQVNRIAEKKAASPAPVGFNQWMKIGVILLLIGLVVGIAFADLGYLVAVIGVVFLVLGLIQQL